MDKALIHVSVHTFMHAAFTTLHHDGFTSMFQTTAFASALLCTWNSLAQGWLFHRHSCPSVQSPLKRNRVCYLKQGSANYLLYRPKYDPPPACVNEILLEHNPTHSFMYCLWLLLRDHMALKPKILNMQSCTEKAF